MNRLACLIVAAFLVGCGKPPGSWPKEVDEYVHRYSDLSRSFGRYSDRIEQVQINFATGTLNGSETVIGYCRSDTNSVTLRREFWDTADTYERQALVFHELGHCIHFLPHRDGVDPRNGWPTSIMNSYLLWSWQYSRWYDYYNAELFSAPFDLPAARVVTSGRYEDLCDFRHSPP